jgi:hypothetical protein
VYKGHNGVLHGFEAVPVPEPSAFVLLVAALVATVTWQCRRSVTSRVSCAARRSDCFLCNSIGNRS